MCRYVDTLFIIWDLIRILALDIVERFTLSLMLFTVALRNLIELSGAEFDPAEGIVLPKSFGWTRGGNLVWTIFYVSSNSFLKFQKTSAESGLTSRS